MEEKQQIKKTSVYNKAEVNNSKRNDNNKKKPKRKIIVPQNFVTLGDYLREAPQFQNFYNKLRKRK